MAERNNLSPTAKAILNRVTGKDKSLEEVAQDADEAIASLRSKSAEITETGDDSESTESHDMFAGPENLIAGITDKRINKEFGDTSNFVERSIFKGIKTVSRDLPKEGGHLWEASLGSRALRIIERPDGQRDITLTHNDKIVKADFKSLEEAYNAFREVITREQLGVSFAVTTKEAGTGLVENFDEDQQIEELYRDPALFFEAMTTIQSGDATKLPSIREKIGTKDQQEFMRGMQLSSRELPNGKKFWEMEKDGYSMWVETLSDGKYRVNVQKGDQVLSRGNVVSIQKPWEHFQSLIKQRKLDRNKMGLLKRWFTK